MAEIYVPFKRHSDEKKYTSKEATELARCAVDPIYFIENFVKVTHPTKGPVPLVLYEYQKEMVTALHNNQASIFLAGRQLGKSTIISAYLLWFAMFNEAKTVLVVANTQEQALVLMDIIRYAYEEIPNHIRDVSPEYNKKTIKFSNSSKIVCRATTPNAGRGLSISYLWVDELSFIAPNIQERFWTSIQPTLSTGGKCIISSTPISDNDIFAQLWLGAIDNVDENGNERELGTNGFKAVKAIWSQHPDRNADWEKEQRGKIGDNRFEREHNCIFLAEEDTLINAHALNRLKVSQPHFTLGTVRFYKDIDPTKTYIVSLDPATGSGKDFSTIQILEMPSMIQAGEWMANNSPPREQIRTLQNILKFLRQKMSNIGRTDDTDVEPNIFWSFENNGVGEAIMSLILEIGEEYFPGTLVNEPKVMGHIKKFRRGLNTTNRNKVTACLKMKTYIDTDRMLINSPGLIHQLKNFVASGVGFAGKPGVKDDLVMATVIALRIAEICKEWGGYDPDVLNESIDDSDDEEPPMPIIFIR